jgi:anti-anti-sigma regulatory factor
MEFKKQYWEDIFSVKINLKRATFLEAENFKEVFDWKDGKQFKKVIIDLSECIYIDPMFLGVLISSLKKLASLGGNLKIVLPEIGFNLENNVVKALRIFDTYNSHQEAIDSYKKVFVTPINQNNIVEEIPKSKVLFSM